MKRLTARACYSWSVIRDPVRRSTKAALERDFHHKPKLRPQIIVPLSDFGFASRGATPRQR
jgi:hypothetical protein